MKIMALSEKEIELLARLEYEGKEIYTRDEIISFCENKKRAGYLIKKMLEKKRLRKIIKNIYILIPMRAPYGKWSVNEYLVAKALARKADYYIGYASVFNSYGFTDQVSQMLCVVNNKYSFTKIIFGVKYKLKKVLPDRLYGLEKRKIGREEVLFPGKERAIIDAFEFYDIKKAAQILQSQLNSIDKNLLVEYVSGYPVQVVRRRMGYFLERLGISKKMLGQIKIGKKGYTPLYKNGFPKGKLNDRWRIIVNG